MCLLYLLFRPIEARLNLLFCSCCSFLKDCHSWHWHSCKSDCSYSFGKSVQNLRYCVNSDCRILSWLSNQLLNSFIVILWPLSSTWLYCTVCSSGSYLGQNDSIVSKISLHSKKCCIFRSSRVGKYIRGTPQKIGDFLSNFWKYCFHAKYFFLEYHLSIPTFQKKEKLSINPSNSANLAYIFCSFSKEMN